MRAASSTSPGEGKPKSKSDVLLASTVNGVRTLTMNRPDKLNAWTRPMMEAIQGELASMAKDDSVKVAVLTGTGNYYCAGVNLSDTLKPMHPKKLFKLIVKHNQGLFDSFIVFPKVGLPVGTAVAVPPPPPCWMLVVPLPHPPDLQAHLTENMVLCCPEPHSAPHTPNPRVLVPSAAHHYRCQRTRHWCLRHNRHPVRRHRR